MLQDLQWDGCRKETDYYEKSYGSRRNSNFRDTQVDIKDNSWSVEAGLRTCQNNSSSIRYGGKDISFIRKNGNILRGTDMLKKIKKVIAFALALTMLMGMGTMVSAAEKESSIPEYSETNDGGMTVNIAGDQEGTIVEGSGNEEGINPLWWPGDGPAPQVTSISLYKYGWLTNSLGYNQ